ncbi:hypothetical protein HY969_02635 [Candidatus Kaiserbacteria bacterium]|nr:hypothetical protein [Candidatus Kaiserbacteria bacterium]
MSIAFAGMIIGGGAAGTWATGASLLLILITLVLSLKWGTTDITRSDKAFLGAALLAIVPWAITKNPLGSVILASAIDACGIAPTIRKTWRAPLSESLAAWIFALLRTGFQIAALAVYTPLTVLYLAEVMVADVLLLTVILYRRSTSERKIP